MKRYSADDNKEENAQVMADWREYEWLDEHSKVSWAECDC